MEAVNNDRMLIKEGFVQSSAPMHSETRLGIFITISTSSSFVSEKPTVLMLKFFNVVEENSVAVMSQSVISRSSNAGQPEKSCLMRQLLTQA